MAEEDKQDEKKSVEARQKKNKKDEVYNNKIEINPKLEEAAGGTAVVGWGRMNPITSGHEKLVNKISDVARKSNAKPLVFLTHSQDAKKNPLSYDDKIMLAKKAFGSMIQKSKSKTIIQVMQELEKKFKDVILVVGADRIKEFETLLNRYNGKDYSFDSIKVVSAGQRTDPDSDAAKEMTADTMSASVMRKLASEGDKETFKKGLPKKLQRIGDDVYDMVRGGMKLAEELEEQGLLSEVLNRQQRRQRAITMRRYKTKIANARKRSMRKAADSSKLEKRARKAAIQAVRKKVAQKRGENYSELDPAQKMLIDKKVAKRKHIIDRIAKKLLPKVRKQDRERLSARRSKKMNEEFELFFEARQDPDIKDREGTQPAKYHSGLSKSTKAKRDAHFKKGAKMDDDNPAAYKPAPGDAEAETKPSKHTKRYHQMFTKEGKIKTDGRFRAFKKMKTEDVDRLRDTHQKEREALKRDHEREMDRAKTRVLRKQIRDVNKESYLDEFDTDKDLLEFIEQTANDIFDSIELDEAKNDDGLKKKAEKSGMPLSILRKVYDRGVAAWRTGHRPGTTPQQWGFARVNSFITKSSGTWGKADADLAAKVRGSAKKEEVEEAVSPAQQAAIAIAKKKKEMKEDDKGPCWTGYKQVGMKMKNGKEVPNCVPEETQLDEWVCGQCNNEPCTCEDMNGLFEKYMAHDPWRVKKAASVTVNRKMYNHALDALKKLLDRKKKEAGSAKNMRHGSNYYAAQIARSYDGVDARTLHNMLDEEYIIEVGGAGDRGTPKVTKRYKKDTPGESVNESLDDLFEAQFKVEIEGLPDMFVDAKSSGEVMANMRKKLKKPDDVKNIERVTPDKIKQHLRLLVRGEGDATEVNEDVTQKQISDLEKFADRLLDKFGVDVEFTRHFADRMNDDRNNPKITIPELQRFFKKVAKNKAKDIKQNADSEAVLNDIQADLNLPVVIKYDRNKEEFEVVNKTIMRKKNFKTPNKVIKY